MIYARVRKTEVARRSNIYKQRLQINTKISYKDNNRVLNVRGEIIPLLDLAYRLNHDIDYDKAKIIITYKNDQKIGLIVQSVKDVIDYYDSELEIPPSTDVSFIKGLVKKDITNEEEGGSVSKKTRVLTVLDTDKIINDEDTKFELVD